MEHYIFGTLLFVNDFELTFFITNFEKSFFRRWMFQYGWKLYEDVEFYNNGVWGYKLTFIRKGHKKYYADYKER